MRKSRANKKDKNQDEIVEALRAIGATVFIWDEVDLIVGYRNRNYLLEVKSDTSVLKDSQKDILKDWEGQYDIVQTPEQALRVIGARWIR